MNMTCYRFGYEYILVVVMYPYDMGFHTEAGDSGFEILVLTELS